METGSSLCAHVSSDVDSSEWSSLISQMIQWDGHFRNTEGQEYMSLISCCVSVKHMPNHSCCSYPCLWTSPINTCPWFQLSFSGAYCLKWELCLKLQIQIQARLPCSLKSSVYWCISKTRHVRENSTNYSVIFLKAVKGFYKNIWGFMPYELYNLKLNRYCIKASKQQL